MDSPFLDADAENAQVRNPTTTGYCPFRLPGRTVLTNRRTVDFPEETCGSSGAESDSGGESGDLLRITLQGLLCAMHSSVHVRASVPSHPVHL